MFDFNPSQLGYDGERWVLFDFGKTNRFASSGSDKNKHTFSKYQMDGADVYPVPERIYPEIKKAIKRERKNHR